MKLQWIQARLNLWKPRWTADPPAVDKTVAMVMISHPTRGTMWIVIGEVDKGKRLFLFWSSDYFSLFFFFLDLLIISVTTGHAYTHVHTHVYLPLPALRSPTTNYVIVKFSSFLFALFGAAVSLLLAASVRTEAGLITGEWLYLCACCGPHLVVRYKMILGFIARNTICKR